MIIEIKMLKDGVKLIKIITDYLLKQKFCKEILDDLPEWFGIDESTEYYINAVVQYPFIAYYVDDEAIGFYSLRKENAETLEKENAETLDMFVLGVKKVYHSQGIGRKLQKYVFDYAKENKYKYCIVLTLSDIHPDSGYALTRDFYHKLGFHDIYKSNKIWDESNPTQIMIKVLKDHD